LKDDLVVSCSSYRLEQRKLLVEIKQKSLSHSQRKETLIHSIIDFNGTSLSLGEMRCGRQFHFNETVPRLILIAVYSKKTGRIQRNVSDSLMTRSFGSVRLID